MKARIRWIRLLLAVVGVLLAVQVVLHFSRPSDLPDDPDSLTLYSIDGEVVQKVDDPADEAFFHGYPIVGKTDIQDPAARRAIMKALQRGISESNGPAASCFFPRHAIRVRVGNHQLDGVICFQCRQIEIHRGGGKYSGHVTTDSPMATLNQYLNAAGVPPAPNTLGH